MTDLTRRGFLLCSAAAVVVPAAAGDGVALISSAHPELSVVIPIPYQELSEAALEVYEIALRQIQDAACLSSFPGKPRYFHA